MSEEILINVTPPETRVAIVENGVVQEVIIERTHQLGLIGNIYKGVVCRVLPGMQAAFVEIGLERAAFNRLIDTFSSGSCDKAARLMLYLECILKCAQAGSFWLMLDDLPLSVRTLRDLYTDNIEKVKVDSRKTYLRLIKFAEEFVPDT
jgi:Ribonuclease G/E